MMTGSGKVLEGLKRLKLSSKGSIYRVGDNPNTDWAALLVFFLVVSACVAGYVVYSMNIFSKGLDIENIATGKDRSRILDEDKLRSVIEFYEARRTFQVSGEAPDLVDPSI